MIEANSLDILNIMDILKNGDLYQERLEALKEATKALNDGKYVNATMEQAHTIMEATQAAKEKAEQEIQNKRDLLRADQDAFEKKMAIEFSELEKQRQLVKQMKADLDRLLSRAKQDQEALLQEHKDLSTLRSNVIQKEVEADKRYQEYLEKVRKLQAIIN